ncbi:MAG: polysaccharide deacetylase family protein [Actinophytocola sp.]|nr:polysaccharide deacetylase family protein [Actinophytocola sp.]
MIAAGTAAAAVVVATVMVVLISVTPNGERAVGEPGPPTTPATSTTTPFPAELAGKDLERIPTSRRVVALTFDAGGNGGGTASILDTLGRTGVPATFFLTGGFVRGASDAARAIVNSGHRIGNHSETHPEFSKLTDAEIGAEMAFAERTLNGIGADPRPLFRFPYGDRDAGAIRAVNDTGYLPVGWTVDTAGWKGTSAGMTQRQAVRRVLNTLGPGQIVLAHVGAHPSDGSTIDADALPTIIREVRERGYRFVSLDTLLSVDHDSRSDQHPGEPGTLATS